MNLDDKYLDIVLNEDIDKLYNISKGNKENTKRGMIFIDYDELVSNEYYGTKVLYKDDSGNNQTVLFNTRNPVEDFAEGIKFSEKEGITITYSSSVHDFASDTNRFSFDENDMLVERDFNVIGEFLTWSGVDDDGELDFTDFYSGVEVVESTGYKIVFNTGNIEQDISSAIKYLELHGNGLRTEYGRGIKDVMER